MPLFKLAQYSLAFLWLFTGFTSIYFAPEVGYQILAKANITGELAAACVYGGGFLDIGLGLWLLFNWHIKTCCNIQILTILSYTLLLSIIAPIFWLHPFGPLTKNLPLLVLIIIVRNNEET